MGRLFEELKRRKVFRVAAVYAVVSWVIIQIADTLFPALQLPDWTVTFITVLLILGFFPTMVVAWAFERTAEGIRPDYQVQASASSPPTSAQPVNYIILAIVLLVAVFQVTDRFLLTSSQPNETASQIYTAPAASRIIRSEIIVPERFVISGGVDISPDGSRIVISGYYAEDRAEQLWIRTMDDLSLTPLPGTGSPNPEPFPGARAPKFSPDGESIVFHRAGRIETLSLSTNASRVLVADDLVNLRTPGSLRWANDNLIYFTDQNGAIARVSPAGGEPEVFLPASEESDIYTGVMEVFPEDQWMLIDSNYNEIAAVSLESGEVVVLAEGLTASYTGDGYLVYMTGEGDLLAGQFNPDTLELSNETLIARIPFDITTDFAMALSDNGTLIHSSSANLDFGKRTELSWVSRSGQITPLEPGWEINAAPQTSWSLSPSGTQVAYQSAGDIWIKRLENGPNQRLTLGGGSILDGGASQARHPAWSPDGQSLIFPLSYGGEGDVDRGEPFDLWRYRTDGGGDPALIADQAHGMMQPVWSKDGEWIVYRSFSGGAETGSRDILGLRLNADAEVIPLIADPRYVEQSPDLSPDGRWLAYTSNLSGQDEVYVRPFPDVDQARWQISTGGGIVPQWSNSGDELFYVDSNRNLVSARLSIEDSVTVQQREVLFQLQPDIYVTPNNTFYDVAGDDQRFLVGRQLEGSTSGLVMVQNFMEEVRERVGVD